MSPRLGSAFAASSLTLWFTTVAVEIFSPASLALLGVLAAAAAVVGLGYAFGHQIGRDTFETTKSDLPERWIVATATTTTLLTVLSTFSGPRVFDLPAGWGAAVEGLLAGLLVLAALVLTHRRRTRVQRRSHESVDA